MCRKSAHIMVMQTSALRRNRNLLYARYFEGHFLPRMRQRGAFAGPLCESLELKLAQVDAGGWHGGSEDQCLTDLFRFNSKSCVSGSPCLKSLPFVVDRGRAIPVRRPRQIRKTLCERTAWRPRKTSAAACLYPACPRGCRHGSPTGVCLWEWAEQQRS